MSGLAVSPPPTGWPSLPPLEAFTGPAADFLRMVEPHSEADRMALLNQFLAAFGNVVGRGPYFLAGRDRHHLNLFVTLVGDTARGRKGQSWGYVRDVFAEVDSEWSESRVVNGLSSGEGVINALRDGQGDDVGETDKRLLVQEGEFASALNAMRREGNTLSPTLRNAWDSGKLRTLTKNSPLRATGTHLALIAHITRAELKRCLREVEMRNGLGNRILWTCARRARLLPDGGSLTDRELTQFATQLRSVVGAARRVGKMGRDAHAAALWHELYAHLSRDRIGLFGAMTARAEAQVLRVSCLFALLDGSSTVCEPHLRSALAVWEYAEASAQFLFGEQVGDPAAERIIERLRERPNGMTRTEIRHIFSGHKNRGVIDAALETLLNANLAEPVTEPGAGRPTERWLATRRE